VDNDLQELEAELHRLRPVAPDARLRAALERKLSVRPQARLVRYSWLALPLAAAAALALILWTTSSSREKAPPAAVGIFKPVAAEDRLLNPRAESFATLADGTVVRRTRETSLATIMWKNPRTNASLTWRVPREEVRVVPVSYQ
jgi:hypothetical protein